MGCQVASVIVDDHREHAASGHPLLQICLAEINL